MSPNQRKTYIGSINDSFNYIDDKDFAELSEIILEKRTGIKLERRGQTIKGQPVGYIVDSSSEDFDIVAEFSVETTYFTDKKNSKIKGDIRHCISIAPNCNSIFLMSSSECGPSKKTYLTNYVNRLGKQCGKEVYILDSRSISEFIVDEIINKQDSHNIDRLTSLIPPLTQIKNEYVFTNTLPSRIANNVRRENDEQKIYDLLEEFKHVHLHGISGIGKTYLAIETANTICDSSWSRIWISGENINEPEDLLSLKIERYGVSQNVIGLLNRFKTILVIDGLENNTVEIINYLENQVKNDYRLITTSQIEISASSKFHVKHLNEDLSRLILNNNLESPCPDDIFDAIYDQINGHPFLLNQINILIKFEGVGWNEIKHELQFITGSTDSKNQPFFNRIFANHYNSIRSELSCLKWINSNKIEYSLLLELVGISGIKKLKNRDFFNTANNTYFNFHDIVFNSLKALDMSFDSEGLKIRFKLLLEKKHKKFDPDYFRIIHSHYQLVDSILKEETINGIISYSYLQSVKIEDFDESKLPTFNDEFPAKYLVGYTDSNYYELLSWIELTEVKYRFLKKDGKQVEFLKPQLDKLLQLTSKESKIPNSVKLDVKNHIGKFQRNIGDREKAKETFKEILAEEPNFWAAKFHLAKLLRKDDQGTAEKLISSIVSSYGGTENLSPTIVLATFKELRSHKKLQRQYVSQFINDFSNLISQTMVSNFDLPYEVLGALSSDIGYNNPEKLVDMAESLPIPSENSIDNSTVFDVGQIYFNLSKAYKELGNDTKSKEFAAQSIAFFNKINEPDTYQKRILSEAYLFNEDFSKSESLLLEVSEDRREIWWNYSYCKTLRSLGHFEKALSYINYCIEKSNEFNESTFFRERAIVKHQLKDSSFKDDYEQAITKCNPGKFKDAMIAEFKKLMN